MTAPPPGAPEELGHRLVCVTAPNPGPMTFTGTRSYVLGAGGPEAAVIDPGPDDPAHLDALEAALGGASVGVVLVTHAHLDHSAGARAFAGRVGAPVLAHGDPVGARPTRMADLARRGGLGGGEGIDARFSPDRLLRDGDRIEGRGWTLDVLHTPGHIADHLCFAWREGGALFTGDTVMGWASTMISPPDGDLGAFMTSLVRLGARSDAVHHSGHGPPVTRPQARVAELVARRRAREREILEQLAVEPADAPTLVLAIYRGVDPLLRSAATRNVLAHLIDLSDRGLVVPDGPLSASARFAAA